MECADAIDAVVFYLYASDGFEAFTCAGAHSG